jgi:hypothetical protein
MQVLIMNTLILNVRYTLHEMCCSERQMLGTDDGHLMTSLCSFNSNYGLLHITQSI